LVEKVKTNIIDLEMIKYAYSSGLLQIKELIDATVLCK